MKQRIFILTLLLLVVLLIPLGVASAEPNFDRIIKDGETVHEDIVIFGGSLLIEEGATVDGDVSVFGGLANIEGNIDGDVVIFGGDTTLSGSVDGDLVIFGGALHLNSSADVANDCILIGGTLVGDGVAGNSCTAVGDIPGFVIPPFVDPPEPPAPPSVPEIPQRSPSYSPQGKSFYRTVSSAAGTSLLFGILALVIAYVAPNHLGQVNNTLRRKPVASGVVGFLTGIAVPSIGVILGIVSFVLTFVCIGLLGWPILFILIIGFVVALLLGWVAAGNLIGQKIAVWLKLSNRSLPVTAALGTVILTLAAEVLSSFPFLLGGWFWSILAFFTLCAGLGAVALTRFGSRPYPEWAAGNGEKIDAVLETLPVEDDADVGQ